MENHRLTQIVLALLWILYVDSDSVSSENECGVPIGSFSKGKIVGGYNIGYFKYPWYVALMKDGEVYCGGTLIHMKFIVTAAHCFQPFFKIVEAGQTTFEKLFKPVFGVYNICRSEPTQKEFKVANVFVHEKYRKMDPYFDIALIKLKSEARGFQPCCLPKKALHSSRRPREALISGLGDRRFHAMKATCTVNEARILIYNDKVCRDMLDSEGEEGKNLKHAFCAGYLQGGIDACQGDSGGPLIIAGRNGRFELLGITSFGFDCAKPGALGIYTDVSQYLNWLRKKMRTTANSTITTTISPEITPNKPPHVTPGPQQVTSKLPETSESDVDIPNISDSSGTDIAAVTSTERPVRPTSSPIWGSYPVTPWDLSFPDIEVITPSKPSKLGDHHKYGPITIIFNWKKQSKHKNKKQMLKHKKERKKKTKFHHISEQSHLNF